LPEKLVRNEKGNRRSSTAVVMGLRPTEGDEGASVQQQLSIEPSPFPFVIPSEAEGSAVPRTSPGNAEFFAPTELSSRPSVAEWRDLRFSLRTLIAYRAQCRERIHPVRRTNCSASILVPKIETLGIWPRAIATSSQRYSRGQFWQSL
jgi:hypothetical protein